MKLGETARMKLFERARMNTYLISLIKAKPRVNIYFKIKCHEQFAINI